MSKNSRKPRKPRPDFALFAHANGQWAKKIRGRLHDFGSWSDPEAALQEYPRIKDDLQAGRIPTLPASGAITLADVCNVHLPQSKERHDGGEIGLRTLDDSHDACKPIVAHLGRKVDPEQLRPAGCLVALRQGVPTNKGCARVTDIRSGREEGFLSAAGRGRRNGVRKVVETPQHLPGPSNAEQSDGVSR